MANSVSIRWSGLEDLKALLRTLPAELAAEGGGIVESHARAAANVIEKLYPIGRTGHLAGGVRVTLNANGRYGTGALVKNAAQHSFIYEHGTEPRTYAGTDTLGRVYGKKPSRGRMKAHPVFIPAMQDFRDLMYENLAAMLTRHGFYVTVTRVT